MPQPPTTNNSFMPYPPTSNFPTPYPPQSNFGSPSFPGYPPYMGGAGANPGMPMASGYNSNFVSRKSHFNSLALKQLKTLLES